MKRLLVLAAILSLPLAGCSGDADGQEEYSAVCTDAAGSRVDDSLCGDPNGSGVNGFLWFYMLSSLTRPAVGTQVVHNTYYTSAGATYSKPPSSSKVVRVPSSGAAPKPVNPAPKPVSPQDKPVAPVKQAPANPKPPAPAKR